MLEQHTDSRCILSKRATGDAIKRQEPLTSANMKRHLHVYCMTQIYLKKTKKLKKKKGVQALLSPSHITQTLFILLASGSTVIKWHLHKFFSCFLVPILVLRPDCRCMKCYSGHISF